MRNILLTLCAVMLMTGTAFAVDRAGALSVSPFAGGYSFDGSQHLRTRPVYGVRLGYEVTDNFAAEGVFDYVAGETTNTNQDLNIYSYRLDLLYNLTPRTIGVPFIPFVAAGGGATTSEFRNDQESTSATFNYGIGAKYFMTDSMALRTDLRHLLVFDGDPTGSHTISNYEYTIGVTFLFGGPTSTKGGYR